MRSKGGSEPRGCATPTSYGRSPSRSPRRLALNLIEFTAAFHGESSYSERLYAHTPSSSFFSPILIFIHLSSRGFIDPFRGSCEGWQQHSPESGADSCPAVTDKHSWEGGDWNLVLIKPQSAQAFVKPVCPLQLCHLMPQQASGTSLVGTFSSKRDPPDLEGGTSWTAVGLCFGGQRG